VPSVIKIIVSEKANGVDMNFGCVAISHGSVFDGKDSVSLKKHLMIMYVQVSFAGFLGNL
jgi:hypothetical protein